jgi:PAS domain-containing protein
MAIMGQRGYVEGTDYRGTAVASIINPIPNTAWFMITKVDRSEVFAAWYRQSILILCSLLCFILFAGSTAVLIWQRNAKAHFRALFRAEAERHSSEKKFRDLFESMRELAVLHELSYGPDGKAIDYRILDCNPAFTLTTGITREAAIGKLASVVFNTVPPPYLDIYTQVAESGKPTRLEVHFAPMHKWFSISVVSPQQGQFATISTDISHRKHSEEERERLNKEAQINNIYIFACVLLPARRKKKITTRS